MTRLISGDSPEGLPLTAEIARPLTTFESGQQLTP